VFSHRQFVQLARAMAEHGFAVLRFDHRGMGDSHGSARDFRSVSDDVTRAIDELCRLQPTVQTVVLWGLCDGASAALLHTRQVRDRRVGALCLVNPWARTETGLARVQLRHYYIKRLLDREFWSKLLRGGVRLGAAADLLRNVRLAKGPSGEASGDGGGTPDFLDEMARACQEFVGPLLILCSGADLTAKEFQQVVQDTPAWRDSLKRDHVQQVEVPAADHTFSGPGEQAVLNATVVKWLSERVSTGHSAFAANRGVR
jgi:uncharacterized protein